MAEREREREREHAPWSSGSRAGLVITSNHLARESLELIVAQSMGKSVTFYTRLSPIFLLKKDSNCLVINETLHLEQGANSSLPSDWPRPYH